MGYVRLPPMSAKRFALGAMGIVAFGFAYAGLAMAVLMLLSAVVGNKQ